MFIWGKAETCDFSAYKAEGLGRGGFYLYVNTRTNGVKKSKRKMLFSVAQTKIKKVIPEHQKILFPCVSDQTLT